MNNNKIVNIGGTAFQPHRLSPNLSGRRDELVENNQFSLLIMFILLIRLSVISIFMEILNGGQSGVRSHNLFLTKELH